MNYEIRLGPIAVTDLIAIHRWIAREAGAATADGYLERIERKLASLGTFASRGTPRDDLAPGVRTLTFERRLTIAYRTAENIVTVLRVVHGARELAPLLDASAPEE